MGRGNRYEGLDEYSVRSIKHKARQLVGKAGFVNADREDLEQELAVDLWLRLPQFDPTKSKRETFVSRVIDHKVATLIESQTAGVRDHRRCAGSLDEQNTGIDEGEQSPLESEYQRQSAPGLKEDRARTDLRLDLDRALSGLPPELRRLLEQLPESSLRECARSGRVSRRQLDNVLRGPGPARRAGPCRVPRAGQSAATAGK